MKKAFVGAVTVNALVAVDRTPNLPIERRLRCHWANRRPCGRLLARKSLASTVTTTTALWTPRTASRSSRRSSWPIILRRTTTSWLWRHWPTKTSERLLRCRKTNESAKGWVECPPPCVATCFARTVCQKLLYDDIWLWKTGLRWQCKF